MQNRSAEVHATIAATHGGENSDDLHSRATAAHPDHEHDVAGIRKVLKVLAQALQAAQHREAYALVEFHHAVSLQA